MPSRLCKFTIHGLTLLPLRAWHKNGAKPIFPQRSPAVVATEHGPRVPCHLAELHCQDVAGLRPKYENDWTSPPCQFSSEGSGIFFILQGVLSPLAARRKLGRLITPLTSWQLLNLEKYIAIAISADILIVRYPSLFFRHYYRQYDFTIGKFHFKRIPISERLHRSNH